MIDNLPLSNEQLRQWREYLVRLTEVRLPQGRNVPNSHPLVFLLFTCDDGIQHTKNWEKHTPEEMIVLLERMFPGDLDEQKHTLIELLAATARALTGTDVDLGGRHPPSPMEWLEAECVARLPSLPSDPAEQQRWTRLRDMRREWLFGAAETWTGVSQTVEASRFKRNYSKPRGAYRKKMLVSACQAVVDVWLSNIDAVLAGCGRSTIADAHAAQRGRGRFRRQHFTARQ